jgi:hypothetical protein
MVFGFIPECRSASFRNQRSASPESSDAGEDRDLASGDAQRDALQVVLPSAADLNVFLGHGVPGRFSIRS